MSETSSTQDPPAPRKAIRRFDVFAEVNRLEAVKDGRPEDEAKGHGIWLAKVVAGRRFGRTADSEGSRDRRRTGDEPDRRVSPDFRSAGGEPQTDETFDHEIVERMGRAFYDGVFAPAIRAAVGAGNSYEQIRDTIRADWKPRR
jgi:hypothetical protein